jgi:hypothetical protein
LRTSRRFRDGDGGEARLLHPVLGLGWIPGHPGADVLEHADGGQPALGRHAAVRDQEHARARRGGHQRGGGVEGRDAIVTVVRRRDAHDAVHPAAGQGRARARGAGEARELVDAHALPAHGHEEGRDLDVPRVSGEDHLERAVGLVVGQVATVPGVGGTQDPQEIAERHWGRGEPRQRGPAAA